MKGAVVTGYEPKVPLERGEERDTGGEVGEGREDWETSMRFRLAMLESVSHQPLTIYDIRVFYTRSEAGNRVISPISHTASRVLTPVRKRAIACFTPAQKRAKDNAAMTRGKIHRLSNQKRRN